MFRRVMGYIERATRGQKGKMPTLERTLAKDRAYLCVM